MGDENARMQPFSLEEFIQAHRAQLLAADFPESLWPMLFKKLSREVFDSGEYMVMMWEEEDDAWKVNSTREIKHDDPNAVFLIDHAWSFRKGEARDQLRSNGQLLKRVSDTVSLRRGSENERLEEDVVGEDGERLPVDEANEKAKEDVKKEDMIDQILRRIWSHIGTYSLRLNNSREATNVWYLVDELGCRISHARGERVNARLFPLFFAPQSIAYSILFFTKDVPAQGEICIDRSESLISLQHPDWADVLEYPYVGGDFSEKIVQRQLPDDIFFLGGRVADLLPNVQTTEPFTTKRPLKVITDDTQLLDGVKEIPLTFVEDIQTADIVWMHQHFHDFKWLSEESPGALVNQFPHEACLTTKDLLAACLTRTQPIHPYHQETYNLNTELPRFAAYFQKRSKRGEDNTWIIKPWNLARGLDMYVADDLAEIIRLLETGPKIACKYITRPLLFPRPDNGRRVKFDMRFIVFVNAFRPLQAYIYNNFWIRFAINEFSLDELDNVETHFTVFNYADPAKVLQMECDEFVAKLCEAYPELNWEQTRQKIHLAIVSILKDASSDTVPRGVAANAQSRAMYGVDVMLHYNESGSLEPSILEVNFMPDCTRALKYYPDFADTVIRTMFLGEIDEDKVTKL